MKLSEAKQRLREEGYRLHKLNEGCYGSSNSSPCGGYSSLRSELPRGPKPSLALKVKKPGPEVLNAPKMLKILRKKFKNAEDIYRFGKHYIINLGNAINLVYIVKNPKELSAEYKGIKINGRFFVRKEDVIDEMKDDVKELKAQLKEYEKAMKVVDSIDYSIAE